jgi:hypothetical protein
MNRAAAYVNRAVANYAARERMIARNQAGWRDADQVAGEPPMAQARPARRVSAALPVALASCPVCAASVRVAGLCVACQNAGRNAANGEL